MTYTYVHHSGRFDRTPASLVEGFNNDLDAHGANIVAFTEVGNEARAAALRARATEVGFGFFRGQNVNGLDECALTWDTKLFDLVEGFSRVLSDIETTSTSGTPRAPFTGTFVVLQGKWTKHRVVIAVAHTPSHVQDGNTWYKNRRALQHRAGLKTANSILAALGRNYKPLGGRILSMDLNLDINKSFVKAYLLATLPQFRLLEGINPDATLGSRTIDVVLAGRRVFKRTRVHAYPNVDSDHKSIVVRLTDEAPVG